MGQFFGNEILKTVDKVSTTQVKLNSGSHLLIGGQGYNLSSDVYLTTSSLVGSTLYYIYINQDLVLDIQATAPSLNTNKKLVGAVFTNSSGDLESITNIEGTPEHQQADLNVTGTNWTTARAVGLYSKMVNAHRFSFNISGDLSSGVTNFTATVNGVTFKVGLYQAISTMNQSTNHGSGQTLSGTSNLGMYTPSSVTSWRFSGDVELESEPTWNNWSNVPLKDR